MSLYWLQRIYDKIVSGISVTQDAKDRTISNVPTIAPSGDMARKAYFDRTPSLLVNHYEMSLGSHSTTERWSYTVPSGKKAIHSVVNQVVRHAINTAGKACFVRHNIYISGEAPKKTWAMTIHSDTDGALSRQVLTATFLMMEDDQITGETSHDDDVNHVFWVSSIMTEFDE